MSASGSAVTTDSGVPRGEVEEAQKQVRVEADLVRLPVLRIVGCSTSSVDRGYKCWHGFLPGYWSSAQTVIGLLVARRLKTERLWCFIKISQSALTDHDHARSHTNNVMHAITRRPKATWW